MFYGWVWLKSHLRINSWWGQAILARFSENEQLQLVPDRATEQVKRKRLRATATPLGRKEREWKDEDCKRTIF